MCLMLDEKYVNKSKGHSKAVFFNLWVVTNYEVAKPGVRSKGSFSKSMQKKRGGLDAIQ